MHRPGNLSVVALPPAPGGCASPQLDKLAFVEFDEMGELWRPKLVAPGPGRTPVDGGREQLKRALEEIRQSVAGNQRTVVMVFVHGWKNNSAENNKNVHGFSEVIRYLGQTYCEPVIGVFISWRGDLVTKYMPVSRTLSYFNREKAAIRVPGSAMTDVLNQIILAAHTLPTNYTGADRPKVILVGHSFGGLILERALSQATLSKIPLGQPTQSTVAEPATCRTRAQEQALLPDLVLFVNSAAAATEAKQMLDFLKGENIQYKDCNNNQPRPLLLSISSSSDASTKFAMPVGHGPSFLGFKLQGSLRNPDPPVMWNDPAHQPSQGAFYMSTAAHMEILQSHQVLRAADVPANAQRYAEFTLTNTGEKFVIINKPGRWNDTPYWLMEVPATIVPDHGTIFTVRFIDMAKEFLPHEGAPATLSK